MMAMWKLLQWEVIVLLNHSNKRRKMSHTNADTSYLRLISSNAGRPCAGEYHDDDIGMIESPKVT
jgi:hypothetical protein